MCLVVNHPQKGCGVNVGNCRVRNQPPADDLDDLDEVALAKLFGIETDPCVAPAAFVRELQARVTEQMNLLDGAPAEEETPMEEETPAEEETPLDEERATIEAMEPPVLNFRAEAGDDEPFFVRNVAGSECPEMEPPTINLAALSRSRAKPAKKNPARPPVTNRAAVPGMSADEAAAIEAMTRFERR